MVYINKMDIMGANFYNVLNMMHERLKCNAVPIQLPIGAESDFRGVVDLIRMKAYVFYDELGKDVRERRSPRIWSSLHRNTTRSCSIPSPIRTTPSWSSISAARKCPRT